METQIKKYQKLNEFALKNGVVIFGEGIDTEIPANELTQSFELDYPVYNRSFLGLNLENSIALYDSCIKKWSNKGGNKVQNKQTIYLQMAK